MVKYLNKNKEIRCPKCDSLLATVDKDDPRENHVACRNCWRLFYYVPLTGQIRKEDIPPRTQSSGIRFW